MFKYPSPINLNMDKKYIAGFFDGEGSAMVLTDKRQLGNKTIFRFRPVIKVAQKTRDILDKQKRFLKVGHILKNKSCFCWQINGLNEALIFINQIAPYSILKRKQLFLLKQLINFQKSSSSNHPYSKDAVIKIVKIRDAVFRLNAITRSGIKQKYLLANILQKNYFVKNLNDWERERCKNSKKKLIEYFKEQRKKKQKHLKQIQKQNLCACGCGKKLELYDNKLRQRKFIWGHNQRNRKWSWTKHE